MHLQIRSKPVASPPDIEKLLGRLADAGVNLVAVGGSDVEFGGEFAFVPADEHEAAALRVLEQFEYPHRVLRVDETPGLSYCLVDDRPGALYQCLRSVSKDNLADGRIIRDVLIGVPNEQQVAAHQVPVQIYSEQVRTSASLA